MSFISNTSNEQSEKETWKIIPFILASKTIKHLRINLSKEF
jgi:hypothetical protein